MKDNNELQTEKSSKEDISSQEEIGKRQINDNGSLQNNSDNNKFNRGNVIKSVQQINEPKQEAQPNYEDGKSNRERLLSLSINMIIISIVDLFFHNIFRLSQLAIADDVTIIIMAIFYLSSALKGKSVNHSWIIAPIAFILFIGFIIRCFGITQYKTTILCIIDFFLLFARGFILFFSFPRKSK